MNEENEELKDFINNEADEELEMTAIDRYLQAGSLQQPSANFTQRVMNNLQPASTVTRGLPSRNKILMLAGISDCGRSIQYSHQHHDRSDYYSE
jgi:hypothetical protein